MGDKIFVTKSFLPPRDEFDAYVDKIWQSGQLTNEGPLVKQFEDILRSFIGSRHVKFVANGTLALQLAIRSLDIKEGEIITTPFSYVATTSSILWQNCTPVYVDIDPKTLCMNPRNIEAAISENTKAIMPVHVFGNACEVEKIDRIAKRYGLPVIYDAAHAFGVTYKGRSLLEYGDISICSLHATKLFHTIEGGLVVTPTADSYNRIDLLQKFGHIGDNHYMLGINAKASEFQAAMGLTNLPYISEIIKRRGEIFALYDSYLNGADVQIVKPRDDIIYNNSYYPIIFRTQSKLQKAFSDLEKKGVYPRRYFYPSLNTLPYIIEKTSCPISEDIASRIACLPLYPGLTKNTIKMISEVITA